MAAAVAWGNGTHTHTHRVNDYQLGPPPITSPEDPPAPVHPTSPPVPFSAGPSAAPEGPDLDLGPQPAFDPDLESRGGLANISLTIPLWMRIGVHR